MDRFTDFPLDIQSEILKRNPHYFRVKKNLNEQLFFNQYCNQPITMNEFLSYINDTDPIQVIIFTSLIENGSPLFRVFHYHNGMVSSTELSIQEEDVNEYNVELQYTFNTPKTIEDLLNVKYDELYYDLKTTFNIVNRRNCEKILSGYSKNYTLSVFNEHSPIDLTTLTDIDLYTYFDLCKQLIYYSYNYDILLDQLPRVPLYRGIPLLIFNGLGDFEDYDIEDIEDLIDEYNYSQDIILLLKI